MQVEPTLTVPTAVVPVIVPRMAKVPAEADAWMVPKELHKPFVIVVTVAPVTIV